MGKPNSAKNKAMPTQQKSWGSWSGGMVWFAQGTRQRTPYERVKRTDQENEKMGQRTMKKKRKLTNGKTAIFEKVRRSLRRLKKVGVRTAIMPGGEKTGNCKKNRHAMD